MSLPYAFKKLSESICKEEQICVKDIWVRWHKSVLNVDADLMAIEMKRTMICQPVILCSMQNGFIEVEEFCLEDKKNR